MVAQQCERATAVPLVLAAVGFLAAYAIPILSPGLDRRWLVICEAVTMRNLAAVRGLPAWWAISAIADDSRTGTAFPPPGPAGSPRLP